MKYFKVIIAVIIIFLIGLSFFFVSNSQYESVELDGVSLRIYKNKITLHIKDEIIDSLPIKDKIKEYGLGDVNGNGESELIILTGRKRAKYGKEVLIFAVNNTIKNDTNNNIKEIGRKDFREFNPWKLVIGDIDGDNIDEISLGVYKESPLHPVMAKRPFIYSYIDGGIQPKWRGSRLSRPFTDYHFYDIDEDGTDEIIAIEILEDNKKLINTYKWKGFGFEGYSESEIYEDITDLTLDKGIYINIKEGKDNYKGKLKLLEDNIIIERVD
ncbi:MAG TPA: hypothetical protein VFC60_02090 [Tissierellaceae bacterium]|nr:hypothetical protein [Tissierellaceae bacterium]